MRRFLLLTLIALLVCAGLSGAALWIGRQQPALRLLTALRFTDCAPPCWIGITPGKTTLKAARDQVIRTFPESQGYLVTLTDAPPPNTQWLMLEKPDQPFGVIWIIFDAENNQVIDSIRFSFSSVYVRERPVVADVHHWFGAPLRVLLPDVTLYRPNDLALIYGSDRRGAVAFASPDTRVSWDQQVQLIAFYANGQIPLARSADIRRWQGFKSLRRYYLYN